MLLEKVNIDPAVHGQLSANDLRQVKRVPVMVAKCVIVAQACDASHIIGNIGSITAVTTLGKY